MDASVPVSHKVITHSLVHFQGCAVHKMTVHRAQGRAAFHGDKQ